jgi:hypothetical protein
VRFSAASVHRAPGDRGWLSPVVLTLTGAALAGDTAHAFGRIAQGKLRHDGVALARLALPATLTGDLELSLRLANGASLSVRATALTLAPAPDAVFTEDRSC